MIEKIILGSLSLVFVSFGLACLLNSKWAHEINIKLIEKHANFLKNNPVFGIWFIRIWGAGAAILGLGNLYSLLSR